MKAIIVIAAFAFGGCSTYNVTVNPSPGCANVTINGSKEISTLPIRAEGNTVPVSAIP